MLYGPVDLCLISGPHLIFAVQLSEVAYNTEDQGCNQRLGDTYDTSGVHRGLRSGAYIYC